MKYELTVLLDGKSSPAKKKKFSEGIEKIISSFSGKVVKSKEWGVLDLAYSIKKNKNALYLFWELELPADKVKSLRDKLKLEEDVLRYLLVKSN